MHSVVRPPRALHPVGLLGYELFQLAYVTNDLERAVTLMGDNYAITNWSYIDAGVMRIALAWSNGQQIELIETATDQYQPLYDDWIDKKGDFVIRHHHFGYFVNSDEEWASLRGQIATAGRKTWMDIEIDTMKVIYIEAPELGHFLEYIYPTAEGRAYYGSIAAN
ncbi:VOC family protein [Sphingobium sp. HBC34]|uniref:VOC family protein n=1 Tax=Sphingobium cyanobacteriorum TaxID=3063954 RepID=A0ABT8ZQ85_9SPHN|nr:VOC family protein [Sphingobium sp. HBC34]MDO7836346.1 VOC family protein [Sphingobium sp. HBC34]